MPALYTHQILAEEILERLPEETRARVLEREKAYFFGAQGGDPFYLYEYVFRKRSENVGTLMHKTNVYELFLEFLRYIRKENNPSAYSYALGYVTHYAVDVVFHPYVYWAVEKYGRELSERRKNDKLHFLIEADFDTFFVEKFKGIPVNEYRYPLSYRDLRAAELFPFFSKTLHEALEVNLDEAAFERSMKRFFYYQRLLGDKNYRKRKFLFRAENFFRISHTTSFMMRRSDPDRRFMNESGEQWFYPESPSLTRTDTVWQLADKAVLLGADFVGQFAGAAEGKRELSLNKFGLNFNTGI